MTRRYPAYRDSGHAWLGEVPATWEVSRIKNLFEIRKRIVGELGHDVLSVTQNGIRVRDTESNDGQVSMDYSKYQIVEPDDFVMNHMDLLTGYVDISAFEGVTSPDYRVFAARNSNLSRRYFLYMFQNGYRQRIFYAFGQGASEFGRWRMPTDNFNDFGIPLPPLPEQTAIAAFLDQETAKIDGLVAQQRRLIDLLREKRQAMISHAVTRGLNPHAKIKPSGIDWLGDVPEGWDNCATGRYASVLSGYAFPSTGFSLDENDTPLLRGVNVGVGELRWDETVYWKRKPDDGLDPWVVREGDLIIGMDRPWVSAGVRVAIVQSSDLPCLLLQRVAVIRPDAGLNQRYLMLHLSSDAFVHFFLPDTTGVSVPHISPTQIKNFPIVVPPRHEQDAIVEFVALATAKLDTLTATAESAISLLQERRAALISAAVTGKIDVRPFDLQATDESAEEVA